MFNVYQQIFKGIFIKRSMLFLIFMYIENEVNTPKVLCSGLQIFNKAQPTIDMNGQGQVFLR